MKVKVLIGSLISLSLLLSIGCGKNKELCEENNALRERVESSEGALKISQENVAALQQENNKLREKLNASEKELEGKKKDVERRNLDLEKKNDELEKRRKELESKNEELEAKRKDLETTKGQNNKLVWMIPLLVSVALAVGTLMGLKVRGDVRKASAKAEQGDNGPWGYDR